MVRRKDCASRRVPDQIVEEGYELYKNVHFTLQPELARRLDRYAADEERAKSWVVQKALDAWLTEKGY